MTLDHTIDSDRVSGFRHVTKTACKVESHMVTRSRFAVHRPRHHAVYSSTVYSESPTFDTLPPDKQHFSDFTTSIRESTSEVRRAAKQAARRPRWYIVRQPVVM